MITVGKALLFPERGRVVPKGEGLEHEIWWTGRHPFTSSLTGQTAAELAAAFEEETGAQWTQPLGFAHALFEVAIDALKRAGSADPDALNEALAETNLATVVGPVDFGSGPVPNCPRPRWWPGSGWRARTTRWSWRSTSTASSPSCPSTARSSPSPEGTWRRWGRLSSRSSTSRSRSASR